MKSITQGPWKWSHHTNPLSEANEAVLMASPNGDSASVVIALGPDWQEPLRVRILNAHDKLKRDALKTLTASLGGFTRDSRNTRAHCKARCRWAMQRRAR